MVSAILMAGYSNKREVKKYSKIVAEHYGETFIESGYKPLREFHILKKDQKISKPLMQFALEALSESSLVEEIIIVGHQMLIEQRLGGILNTLDKPYRMVNQNAKIPQVAINLLNIDAKKIKPNSMAGNMVKGYAASTALLKKEHALFVASDSPLTSTHFIKQFLHLAKTYPEDTRIVFPAVIIEHEEDDLGRKPLRLYNDSSYKLPGFTDNYGRQGFRLSSLAFANLYHMNLNSINIAYNLRKCLNPKIQIKLFRVTRDLGYSNVYSKYFIKKNLSITEVENIFSKFIDGRFVITPIKGEETTYDYDGTDKEYLKLTEMLNQV